MPISSTGETISEAREKDVSIAWAGTSEETALHQWGAASTGCLTSAAAGCETWAYPADIEISVTFILPPAAQTGYWAASQVGSGWVGETLIPNSSGPRSPILSGKPST